MTTLTQERFARFSQIGWWNQELLAQARVLVIGAGALGNEVVKNLALLGVGNLVIADMDTIELSNLSRSVLFRAEDEGKAKAEVAAAAARSLYPDIKVRPVVVNVLAGLGLGYFRWAQVVVGALDNREARVFVNSRCAQLGKAWFDGGIEALNGVVRGFSAPATACYECTMSKQDWEQIEKRRSCSLLARQALAQGTMPTTPTTASVIGGMQAQELVKFLHHGHDESALLGKGFFFEGLRHSSYPISYRINPECPWHEPAYPVESCPQFSSHTGLDELWTFAAERLGGLDGLDFSREMVERLTCPGCGHERQLYKALDHLSEADAPCPECGQECYPSLFHGVHAGSAARARTPAQLGLPGWDIIWARFGEDYLGLELSGDRPEELGGPA